MSQQKGALWLENAVDIGGYLEKSPDCAESFHSVQEAIHKLGITYAHDQLIAKLTFGFWIHQFASKEFMASGSTLLQIFPFRPAGTKQKDIYKLLSKINILRNRIAYYEPVCFDSNSIDLSLVKKRHVLIKQLLSWLGCNPQEILSEIDYLDSIIVEIETFPWH